MRLHRLLVAISSIALLPAAAAQAQESRLFDNSWFWGIHAGVTEVGTPVTGSGAQATIGADWLITRSMGGLYVSYDQALFNRTSAVSDTAAVNGTRYVYIHGMRSGSVAAVAFPWHSDGFRPYAGLGMQLSVIGTAEAQADTLGAPSTQVAQRVENARSRTTLFLMGGAQWQVQRAAIFGQVTIAPSDDRFLISRPTTMIVGGVRYNIGSAIDR